MYGLDGFRVKYYAMGQPPPPAPAQGYPWQEIETVEGAHWYEYFSRHHLIELTHHQLRRLPNMYWGGMVFYKNRYPASFGNVISSKLYSWFCYHCHLLHHRFTHHKILLADGSAHLHCHHDSVQAPVPDIPYDPNAHAYAASVFCNAYLAEPVPGEGDPLVRFLVKPCHACGTNHWHAIQGHAWDSQGQSQLFCYSQPLNFPVTVASSYRPHDTVYPIPDGGPGGLEYSGDEGGNGVDGIDQPADDNAAVVAIDQPADQPADDNAAVVGIDQPEEDDNAAVFGNGYM